MSVPIHPECKHLHPYCADGNTTCVCCHRLHEEGADAVIDHSQIVLDRRDLSLAQLYPKYHKEIPQHWDTIDVYGVCSLFPVDDDSGCINHARKKLLVPGVRTGGKSMRKDILEARDTLNRWLELNPE